ncbi:unnamed protein product, partial [Gulo gulo]
GLALEGPPGRKPEARLKRNTYEPSAHPEGAGLLNDLGMGAIQTACPLPLAFSWALRVTMKTLAPNPFHFLSFLCWL